MQFAVQRHDRLSTAWVQLNHVLEIQAFMRGWVSCTQFQQNSLISGHVFIAVQYDTAYQTVLMYVYFLRGTELGYKAFQIGLKCTFGKGLIWDAWGQIKVTRPMHTKLDFQPNLIRVGRCW